MFGFNNPFQASFIWLAIYLILAGMLVFSPVSWWIVALTILIGLLPLLTFTVLLYFTMKEL